MKSYVRRIIFKEQKRVEKLSALVRLGVFSILLVFFLVFSRDFPWKFLPVVLLGLYGLMGLIGLGLAVKGIFKPWFAWVYSTFDVLLLFSFLAALTIEYHIPLHDVLRVPGASLIFLFIILSAIRYRAGLVIYLGGLYATLWGVSLIWLKNQAGLSSVQAVHPLPLETEIMRLVITMIVVAITAYMVQRMRFHLLTSIIESRSRENLSKYLPAGLVHEMADGGVNLTESSHCQNAAVLFIDICGFTKLSENRPPKWVMGMLTGFRQRMNRPVVALGGTIDKFIGDAIMVEFGVPEPGPDDARNSVLCGLEMLKILDAWNSQRAERDEPPVRAGIGIHYGEVIAGAFGDPERLEYTVIGDTVNVAERIEQLTRQHTSSLIISASTYKAALPFEASANFILLSQQPLKGRAELIDVYVYDGAGLCFNPC